MASPGTPRALLAVAQPAEQALSGKARRAADLQYRKCRVGDRPPVDRLGADLEHLGDLLGRQVLVRALSAEVRLRRLARVFSHA